MSITLILLNRAHTLEIPKPKKVTGVNISHAILLMTKCVIQTCYGIHNEEPHIKKGNTFIEYEGGVLQGIDRV